jgi:hypothetical protein
VDNHDFCVPNPPYTFVLAPATGCSGKPDKREISKQFAPEKRSPGYNPYLRGKLNPETVFSPLSNDDRDVDPLPYRSSEPQDSRLLSVIGWKNSGMISGRNNQSSF